MSGCLFASSGFIVSYQLPIPVFYHRLTANSDRRSKGWSVRQTNKKKSSEVGNCCLRQVMTLVCTRRSWPRWLTAGATDYLFARALWCCVLSLAIATSLPAASMKRSPFYRRGGSSMFTTSVRFRFTLVHVHVYTQIYTHERMPTQTNAYPAPGKGVYIVVG